jgi:hypothetical protein
MKVRCPKGLLTTLVRYRDVTCDEVARKMPVVSFESLRSAARLMFDGSTALHLEASDHIRVWFNKPRVEGRT